MFLRSAVIILTVVSMVCSLTLDDRLLDHSIYGEEYIVIGDGSSTPAGGITGSKGLINTKSCHFRGETRTDLFEPAQYGAAKFVPGASLFFSERIGKYKVSKVDGVLYDKSPDNPYPDVEPVLPSKDDLKFITPDNDVNFTVARDGTIDPGKYGSVIIKPTGRKFYLTAGEYHFDKLKIGSTSELVILPNEYGNYRTRIYIKSAFYMGNDSCRIGPGNTEDGVFTDTTGVLAGNVLIVTAEENNTIKLGADSYIKATICAPFSELFFGNNTNIYGQVLAHRINSVSALNGMFIFKPLNQSNVIVNPSLFYEDTIAKGDITYDLKSRSYETFITCSLSIAPPAEAGREASFKYEIRNVTAFNSSDSDYTVEAVGRVRFGPGETVDSIPIFINDDSRFEGDETFDIVFTDTTSNFKNFTIDLGSDSLINTFTIIDDDLDNKPPTDITLSAAEVKEARPKGQIIGKLTAKDEDTEDTHTFSIVGGSTLFEISEDLLITTETGAQKIDFENVRKYDLLISVKDNNGMEIETPKPFTINVLPWNDNRIDDKDDNFEVPENLDTVLAVLGNSSDVDLETSQNVHRVINSFCVPTPGDTVWAKSKLGADILVGGEYAKYSGSSIAKTEESPYDEFWYIVKDSAQYKDGSGNSYETDVFYDTVKVTIKRTLIDDNDPTAKPHSIELFENESLEFDLLAMGLISDLDGGDLTVESVKSPNQGALSVTGTTLRYTHDGSKEAPFTDSFDYVAVSEGKQSVAATVSVVIHPVNDNISNATDNSYTLEESGSVEGNVKLDQIKDSDGDQPAGENILTVELMDKPSNHDGEFILNVDGTFKYRNNGTPGTDEFTYRLIDDVTYKYGDTHDKINHSNIATVTLNVGAANSSTPTAKSITKKLKENETTSIDLSLLIDDKDLYKTTLVPAEKLTVSVPAETEAGTASVKSDHLVEYTHGKGDIKTEIFLDTILYTVSDNASPAHTVTDTIFLIIEPLNDNKPVAKDDIVDAYVGVEMNIYPLKDNGNGEDFDIDLEKVFTNLKLDSGDKAVETAPAFGTLIRKDDNTFTYKVHPNHNIATDGTEDRFEYRIIDPITPAGYDDATVHSATAWVTINIDVMPNDVPVAMDDEIILNEGGTTSLLSDGSTSVMSNDKDSQTGSQKKSVKVITKAKFGTLDFNETTGEFTYIHDDSENFSDFFEYELTAENGKTSIKPGRVEIIIHPLNDNKPVIKADTIRINEGETASLNVINTFDTDDDMGTTLKAVTQASLEPLEGTVTITESGALVYSHSGGESAVIDSFSVTVTDTVDYDPTKGFPTENRVIVLITLLNDNTPAGTDKTYRVDERDTLDISSTTGGILHDVTDADGDAISVKVKSFPTLADTFDLKSDGTFFYVHNGEEKFSDAFTVTLTDGVNDTTLTITIDVNPKNDEPGVINPDLYTVNENGTLTINKTLGVLANDSDSDEHPTESPDFGNIIMAHLVKTDSTQYGTLTLNSDGSFVYVQEGAAVEAVADTFSYFILDSTTYDEGVIHTSEPVQVIITIVNQNDNTPVGTDKTYTVDERGTLNISTPDQGIMSDAFDPDGDDISLSIGNYPALADSFDLRTDGTFFYVHNGDELFHDIFTVTLSDGTFDTTLTVTINVNPKNDEAAVVSPDSYTMNENETLIIEKTAGVLANDSDGDIHPTETPHNGNIFKVYLLTTDSTAYGDLDLKSDGSFTYIHSGGNLEVFADTFSYYLVDSTTYDEGVIHTSEPVEVIITINNVNDELPVTLEDTIVVDEGETATLLKNGESSVLWNDTDFDVGSVLTAALVTGASNGTAHMNEDGTFTYTHDGSATVVDSLFYVASDGVHTSEKVRVTIIIGAKPPVIQSAGYFDINADGIVDQIKLKYNHPVDVTNLNLNLTWDDGVTLNIVKLLPGDILNDVIVNISGSPLYRTSGLMTLTGSHTLFPGSISSDVVSDKTAPVMSSASYSADGSGGVLSITLSETVTGSYAVPFTLITDGDSFIKDLAISSAAGSFKYALPFTELKLAPGDSLYLTPAESVSDAAGNGQINPENLRQPVIFDNGIISVSYLDTDLPADGRIDVISVNTALPIEPAALAMIESDESLITLNSERLFTIEGYELDEGGFNILVTEGSETVNTAVTEKDRFVLNSALKNGEVTVGKIDLEIIDSVAPVILLGTYSIGGDTTFEITYSEPVVTPSASAYSYYETSTGLPFTMEMIHTSAAEEKHLFRVSQLSIDYVVTGDSLKIESALNLINDKRNNGQSHSIYAPIVVSSSYNIELELLVYPQPFVLEKGTAGNVVATPFDKNMVDLYNLHLNGIEDNGVAFIVEANGPLSLTGNHYGEAKLLDVVGNSITDKIPFRFVAKKDGNLAGVAVWDGKNSSGRSVGRGSYQLVVEVSVESDEGDRSRIFEQSLITTVGVIQN